MIAIYNFKYLYNTCQAVKGVINGPYKTFKKVMYVFMYLIIYKRIW
jgi:hypothetical protein